MSSIFRSAAARQPEHGRPPDALDPHPSVGLLVLLAVFFLNVYKPRRVISSRTTSL